MPDLRYTKKIGVMVPIPASEVTIGDLMDQGMDKLRTIHMALCPDSSGYLNEATMLSIWATLDRAIRDLEPVRNVLQGCDTETGKVAQ